MASLYFMNQLLSRFTRVAQTIENSADSVPSSKVTYELNQSLINISKRELIILPTPSIGGVLRNSSYKANGFAYFNFAVGNISTSGNVTIQTNIHPLENGDFVSTTNNNVAVIGNINTNGLITIYRGSFGGTAVYANFTVAI